MAAVSSHKRGGSQVNWNLRLTGLKSDGDRRQHTLPQLPLSGRSLHRGAGWRVRSLKGLVQEAGDREEEEDESQAL